MKNALKNKKVIIIASILLVIGLAIPFGLFFISTIPTLNISLIPYNILLWVFGFVYILIGFVWGDIRVASWRRKNKEWDSELPDDIKEMSWKTRLCFYIPGIAILAVGIIFDIIYMITNSYPFM
jgi:hypothetical protein